MTKKSEIKVVVELDQENVPEKIMWDADDKQPKGLSETKAVNVALWDGENKNTLRIDLWAKDMPVDEMKRFYVDCLGSMAQSLLSATGDEFMAGEMNTLCEKLVQYIKKEMNQPS